METVTNIINQFFIPRNYFVKATGRKKNLKNFA